MIWVLVYELEKFIKKVKSATLCIHKCQMKITKYNSEANMKSKCHDRTDFLHSYVAE